MSSDLRPSVKALSGDAAKLVQLTHAYFTVSSKGSVPFQLLRLATAVS